MISKKTIKKVAREIAEHFHPRQVILFGSHAYGAPTKDSDVDLLVIMETKERNLPQALNISRGLSLPYPMALLVL